MVEKPPAQPAMTQNKKFILGKNAESEKLKVAM